jgi:hypothetical protein
MQAIFGDRIGEIWIPGPWSADEDRCRTYGQPSLCAAIAASSAIPPSRSRWDAREETLKEILGGFRLAAFVHHHKSRHRVEMRNQGNIHPAADMHLGRF